MGAPTGSGKTIIAELAIFRTFNLYPNKSVIYVAPMKALAKERINDWKVRLGKIGKKVLELTGDFTPDIEVSTNSSPITAKVPSVAIINSENQRNFRVFRSFFQN